MLRIPSWLPHIAARLLIMAVVAVVTGLIVAWFDERAALLAWWTGPNRWTPALHTPWDNVLFAALYTSCTWTSVEGSIRLLKRLPLRHWSQVIGHVVLAAVIGFGVAYALHAVTQLLVGTGGTAAASFPTVALVTVTTSVLSVALFFTFSFYRDLRDAEAQRLQAERARTDAELRALRAQINPHFLFNTLNAIATLIRVRPAEAEGTTEHLADLFRYTLRASKQPTVTLADEWAATQHYLAIETTRFRDRLSVQTELHDTACDACVPSLIIQPLVENAVKHGVAATSGTCRVCVDARREPAPDGDTVRLAVRDDGPGFDTTDPDEILRRGTGLSNVQDRLHRTFGDAATLSLRPNAVVLRFPYEPFSASHAYAAADRPRRG